MSTLTLKAKLSRKYIGFGKQSVYLLAEIMAKDSPANNKRLPLNLGFVIDRSGSMTGEKIDFTKQAVKYAVDHLTNDDKASVTVFDQDVSVLHEAGPVIYKDQLKGIIGGIYPGGSTNLSGGIIQGYRQVMRNRQSGQVDRVLLLTDGLANVGITDSATLSAKAAAMRETGVAVTTLGVGVDFDEDLLTAIAEGSGGNYYYIDSPERIPEIFSRELQELLSVVAQGVRMEFRCAEGASVNKVWGYRPQGDRTVAIDMPDVFSFDHKVVLLEIEIDGSKSGEQPLGTIALSYDDVGKSMERITAEIDLRITRTDAENLLDTPDEPDVAVQMELSKAAEEREKAIRIADAGDVDLAACTIKASIDSML